MQKQTKNQIKFHLPVSKMFLTSGALGDCCELQLWHHGSPVSVAGAVLHGPMPHLVVWVPSWGSPGRTELLPLLSYYATTFTLKILPSEFTPGKTASQKAGEKKMRKKNEQFSVLKHEHPWWRKGRLLEQAPRAQNQRRWCLQFSFPGNFIFKTLKHNATFQERKLPKGYKSPACEWLPSGCHIQASPYYVLGNVRLITSPWRCSLSSAANPPRQKPAFLLGFSFHCNLQETSNLYSKCSLWRYLINVGLLALY